MIEQTARKVKKEEREGKINGDELSLWPGCKNVVYRWRQERAKLSWHAHIAVACVGRVGS